MKKIKSFNEIYDSNSFYDLEEAVEIVLKTQYEFPHEFFNDFLNYHEITETQFFELENKWRNLDIWHKKNGKWKLKNEIK